MYGKIKVNRIRCKKCGDIIESKNRYDFEWCSCDTCAVDGGHVYLKRAYRTDKPEDAYEELSEYEE